MSGEAAKYFLWILAFGSGVVAYAFLIFSENETHKKWMTAAAAISWISLAAGIFLSLPSWSLGINRTLQTQETLAFPTQLLRFLWRPFGVFSGVMGILTAVWMRRKKSRWFSITLIVGAPLLETLIIFCALVWI